MRYVKDFQVTDYFEACWPTPAAVSRNSGRIRTTNWSVEYDISAKYLRHPPTICPCSLPYSAASPTSCSVLKPTDTCCNIPFIMPQKLNKGGAFKSIRSVSIEGYLKARGPATYITTSCFEEYQPEDGLDNPD